MAYVYTPPAPPRIARVGRPQIPVRVVPPPRLVGVRPRTAVARIRYQAPPTTLGAYLGQLELAATAIPSVSQLANKALASVIGIVDPGKKRDANRVARANIWCGLANLGSITAARRVLGGSQVQYTPKERQYYIDCWNKLLKSKPALAQQAVTLGALGIPEPGSDLAPPAIPAEDMASLQNEVDAYNQTGSVAPGGTTKALAPASQASISPLLALGLVGAFLARR